MGKVKLSKISSQSFEHEADRKAMEALRKTVGFDRLIRALASITTDKLFGVITSSNYVKIGPKQVPSLHKLYLEVCDTLDMPPPPFYLANMPQMNAFTAGAQQPVIVVTSGLVECMTDAQIQAVLGHELGHWMAGHTLYRMVAQSIKEILLYLGTAYGLGPLVKLGLVPPLMYWYRCAELTADRAGLLAVQDLDTVLTVEMMLASGAAGRFSKELDKDAFMEQAKAVAIDEDKWSNIQRALIEMELTHPWAVVRAREIEKFVRCGEYGRILEGNYIKRAVATIADGPHPAKEEGEAGIAAAAAEIAIGAALARAYGVHVAPRIPEHALHLALGSYVEPLGEHERVMALYDDTFSGTGDKGIVLTSDRVFASNAPRKGVRYAEVTKLEELPSGLLSRPGLDVNGLELRFHTRDVRDAFKSAIQGAAEVYKPQ